MYYYKTNGGITATANPIADAVGISEAEYTAIKTSLTPEAPTEEETEQRYWQSVPYNEAVNTKIRERYTESQEFAILRQKDEKPEEYAEYYEHCEACKAYVKERQGQ